MAALVALYNATGGESWLDNTNWLTSAPITEWYGVSGDRWLGTITELGLNGNNLMGEIPFQLGDLKSLVRLDLSENDLTGEIPIELANPLHLAGLDLSNNQLTGEIPPGVERL